MKTISHKGRQLIIGAVGIILIVGSFAAGHELRNVQIGPLASQSANAPDFSSLNSLYNLLNSKFDGAIDKTKLLDGAKEGLIAAAGDPYTTYLDPTAAKALTDDLKGQLSGIGAEIAIKNSVLTVVSPIADSPAAKAGIKASDQIVSINGEDTSTMTLDQAVAKIRGVKGTTVTLKVVRGNQPAQSFTITRDVINITSVKWSMKPGGIGYIQVTQFGDDTSDKIVEAGTDLKNQHAQKVILDLRNNPGGYLDAGVAVASQFLPAHQLVVEERRGSTSIEKLYSNGNGQLVGLPMVVLINSGSASASEIVAGALADNGVARLEGETSFGKGSVQDITNLAGGAELKITIAHWYTPHGKNINKEGIKPDVVVKLEQADYDAGRDPQLDKALELLK